MTSYELYTIPEKSGNGNQKMDSFCRYRGTDHVQQKQHRQANNCWHHTRACKYNVSVLGTNFECEGVNCIPTSTLLSGDRGNVRSSKKPKLAAKYGLHHT